MVEFIFIHFSSGGGQIRSHYVVIIIICRVGVFVHEPRGRHGLAGRAGLGGFGSLRFMGL